MRQMGFVSPVVSVMLASLLVVLLVACGGSSPATQIPPTALPTATVPPRLTVTPTVLPTTLPGTSAPGSVAAPGEPRGRNCGTVQMRGPQTVNGPSAQQAEDCLWQAFQQCSTVGTAVFTVTQMGVDTLATRVFTLRSSGSGCTIQESVEFRVVPRPPTMATYSCASLTREASGALHFLACGADGDLVVPPPTTP